MKTIQTNECFAPSILYVVLIAQAKCESLKNQEGSGKGALLLQSVVVMVAKAFQGL